MGPDKVEKLCQRAQLAIEKLAHHLAEPGIVLREASRKNGVPAFGQHFFEQGDLSPLPAAINPFHGDENSARLHELKASLTADSRRCNAAHARMPF